MSLDVTSRYVLYPNVDKATFFDDFFSALYDNRLWAVTKNGGDAAMQSVNGGVIKITSYQNQDYELYLGGMCNFSIAKNFIIEWRAAFNTGNGGLIECGLEAATDKPNNFIAWRIDRLGTDNITCQIYAPSGGTSYDTGIPRDTNYHRFKIIGSTGVLQFFLDDVIVYTTTTHLTSALLQPFINCSSAVGPTNICTADVDYVSIVGDR